MTKEDVLISLDRASDMLYTVEQLIKLGSLKRKGNVISSPLNVETVYDKDASVVVIEQGNKGDVFPTHKHEGAVQFLICIQGRFSINFEGTTIVRILNAKECASVPENQAHSVHCLENGSKLIGVVIPIDPAYRKYK